MGSTGSGSFSDYSGSGGSSSGSQGGTGGESGSDRCNKAFSCTLEDVAQGDYYTINGKVPAPKMQLEIVLKSRLMAVEVSSGEVVGALPTSFNYLAACMNEGFSYVGVIISSINSPVPSVTADFTAQ